MKVEKFDSTLHPHMINMMPVRTAKFLELAWRHPGHFLELVRDVGDTAVPHPVGNLAEAQLVVLQKLFDMLDLLENQVLLDRDVLHGGEEGGEVMVLESNLLCNELRIFQSDRVFLVVILHQLEDRVLDLLDRLYPLVFNQLKAIILKDAADLIRR